MLRPSGSHVATETGTHVQRSLRASEDPWGITIPTFGGGIMVNDRYTIHPMGYSSNILFKMMSRYVKMTSVSKCSKIRVLYNNYKLWCPKISNICESCSQFFKCPAVTARWAWSHRFPIGPWTLHHFRGGEMPSNIDTFWCFKSSGQIRMIPTPELRGFWEDTLTTKPPFGWGRSNLPRNYLLMSVV